MIRDGSNKFDNCMMSHHECTSCPKPGSEAHRCADDFPQMSVFCHVLMSSELESYRLVIACFTKGYAYVSELLTTRPFICRVNNSTLAINKILLIFMHTTYKLSFDIKIGQNSFKSLPCVQLNQVGQQKLRAMTCYNVMDQLRRVNRSICDHFNLLPGHGILNEKRKRMKKRKCKKIKEWC